MIDDTYVAARRQQAVRFRAPAGRHRCRPRGARRRPPAIDRRLGGRPFEVRHSASVVGERGHRRHDGAAHGIASVRPRRPCQRRPAGPRAGGPCSWRQAGRRRLRALGRAAGSILARHRHRRPLAYPAVLIAIAVVRGAGRCRRAATGSCPGSSSKRPSRAQQAALEEAARLRAEAEARRKSTRKRPCGARSRKKCARRRRRRRRPAVRPSKTQSARPPPKLAAAAAARQPGRERGQQQGGSRGGRAPEGRGGRPQGRGSRGGGSSPRPARPPAHPGRADGAGIPDGRQRWRVRAAVARDDRCLAEESRPRRHRLSFGGHAGGPAARCCAGARPP